MPRKEPPLGYTISAQAQQDLVSEGIENYELPRTLVTKIAKSAIPENTKLQKETVLSLVKGSTVFINYLAATAHDVAIAKQHKSISASDVLRALELIEFGDLVPALQSELQTFRDLAKADKASKKTTSSTSATAYSRTGASVSAAVRRAAKEKERGGGKGASASISAVPKISVRPIQHSISRPHSGGGGVDVDAEMADAVDAANLEDVGHGQHTHSVTSRSKVEKGRGEERERGHWTSDEEEGPEDEEGMDEEEEEEVEEEEVDEDEDEADIMGVEEEPAKKLDDDDDDDME